MPFLQEYHSIILFKIYKKLEEILILQNSKKNLESIKVFSINYSPTYGNKAICLARLIATANCL